MHTTAHTKKFRLKARKLNMIEFVMLGIRVSTSRVCRWRRILEGLCNVWRADRSSPRVPLHKLITMQSLGAYKERDGSTRTPTTTVCANHESF